MSVATEKIIPGVMPPREETAGVDFLAILDGFDATTLSDRQLELFAVRDPYITGYYKEEETYTYQGKEYPRPKEPVKERLDQGKVIFAFKRAELEQQNILWLKGKEISYKRLFASLNSAISSKACLVYVQRKFDSMSEDDHRKEQEDWDRWEKYFDENEKKKKDLLEKDYEEMNLEERRMLWEEYAVPYGYTIIYDTHFQRRRVPVISVKLLKLRKALGYTQRDFAKELGWGIAKYAYMEQGRLDRLGEENVYRVFNTEFLERVVEKTHVNPYWLIDQSEDSLYEVDEKETAKKVREAMGLSRGMPMFAQEEIIRKWMNSTLYRVLQ